MKKRTKALIGAALALTMGATLAVTGCGSKTTLVVGITDYEPMDYKTEDGSWTGFDYELASKVLGDLGYKVKFEVIDWDTKTVTLNAREIDVIWNGMTITDELQENLLLSDTYLVNRQYGVVKTENVATYTNAASLATAKVAVEIGSAAEGLMVNEDETLNCGTLNKAANQNAAIMEVAAGTSDVAIVDYLLAMSITTNEQSDYYGKIVAVDLGFEAENFAVGFRKSDTDLCNKVNEKIKALYADGTIKALAEKYGIEGQLVSA